MDVVKAAVACALFVMPYSAYAAQPLPATAAANSVTQWDTFITEAARRFSIPDDWIRGVMAQESGGHAELNGKPVTSPKGAMGLMQLMPGTWGDLRARLGLGSDPYDPHDNILAGAAYLRDMADRFGRGAFAAYNAGPERYSAYLAGQQPLPNETQAYLARLASRPSLPGTGRPANGLFIVNNAVPLAAASPTTPRFANAAHDLFVRLAASPP